MVRAGRVDNSLRQTARNDPKDALFYETNFKNLIALA